MKRRAVNKYQDSIVGVIITDTKEWSEGFYLGTRWRTGAAIIGTKTGVDKCGICTAKPMPSSGVT